MVGRGGQLLTSTLRRWRDMQLQRGWRSWLSVVLHEKVCTFGVFDFAQVIESREDLNVEVRRRRMNVLATTCHRWRVMQLQRCFRFWMSQTFSSKVINFLQRDVLTNVAVQ